MSQKTKNILLQVFPVIFATFLVVAIISAWTEPGSAPPGGNVPAPINVGDSAQIKSGPLQVNGFRNIGNTVLDGNVGIGTTAPAAKLDVQGGVKVGSYAVKPTCNANVIGMIVFDTTNDQPYVCASAGWNPLDSKDIANIFGDGRDGDAVLSVDTNLPAATGTDVETGIKQYNNLIINAGVKLSVASGHVLKFKVKDTLTINGEINMDGKGGMGAGFQTNSNGETGDVAPMMSGGAHGDCFVGIYPGRGYLGSGGGSASNKGGSNGGKTALSANGVFKIGGNGGGGGGGQGSVVPCSYQCGGGKGGDGGGVIMISARNIVLNGNIHSRGTPGERDSYNPGTRGAFNGAGGGGTGGIVILEYETATTTGGTISVSGGAGGEGQEECNMGYTRASASGGTGGSGLVFFRQYKNVGGTISTINTISANTTTTSTYWNDASWHDLSIAGNNGVIARPTATVSGAWDGITIQGEIGSGDPSRPVSLGYSINSGPLVPINTLVSSPSGGYVTVSASGIRLGNNDIVHWWGKTDSGGGWFSIRNTWIFKNY